MKIKILGIPIKVTTVAVFGAGFMLGSRSGRGPWDAALAKWNELRDRAEGVLGEVPAKEAAPDGGTGASERASMGDPPPGAATPM